MQTILTRVKPKFDPKVMEEINELSKKLHKAIDVIIDEHCHTLEQTTHELEFHGYPKVSGNLEVSVIVADKLDRVDMLMTKVDDYNKIKDMTKDEFYNLMNPIWEVNND